MDRLRVELGALDNAAKTRMVEVQSDTDLSLELLRSLPAIDTIRGVLPDALGVELATLRMNAQDQLESKSPNYEVLHGTFSNIVQRLPVYREIERTSALVENTANMANALAEVEPELTQQTLDAVAEYRSSLGALAKNDSAIGEVNAARKRIMDFNAQWLATCSDQLDVASALEVHKATDSAAANSVLDTDFVGQRLEEAQRYESLAGNPANAAVSYFEKLGVVPKTEIASWVKGLGEGRVASTVVRDAQLALASAKPSSRLGPPRLPAARSQELSQLVKQGICRPF